MILESLLTFYGNIPCEFSNELCVEIVRVTPFSSPNGDAAQGAGPQTPKSGLDSSPRCRTNNPQTPLPRGDASDEAVSATWLHPVYD